MKKFHNYISKQNLVFLFSLILILGIQPEIFGQSNNSSRSYENLALNKSSRQSTTSYGGLASYANDGKTDGVMSHKSVSHTESRNNSWWEVDLGKEYQIFEVVLYNRTDCCSDRLSKFDIWVTKQPKEQITTRVLPFASEERSLKDTSYKRYTGKESGRYVRIELQGSNNLQLAEVQVYGAVAGKLEIRDIRNVVKYNYTIYKNGTGNEGNISREITNGVSAGYDFSKTVDKSDKKYWDIGVTSSVQVNSIIASASLEISSKYGQESNIRNEEREGKNIARSQTSKKTTMQKVPAGMDRYVFNKFIIKDVPVIYKMGGETFSWVRILDQSASIETTALDVPNGVKPELLDNNIEQWISAENYQAVWDRHIQNRNNGNASSHSNSGNTSNNNTNANSLSGNFSNDSSNVRYTACGNLSDGEIREALLDYDFEFGEVAIGWFDKSQITEGDLVWNTEDGGSITLRPDFTNARMVSNSAETFQIVVENGYLTGFKYNSNFYEMIMD